MGLNLYNSERYTTFKGHTFIYKEDDSKFGVSAQAEKDSIFSDSDDPKLISEFQCYLDRPLGINWHNSSKENKPFSIYISNRKVTVDPPVKITDNLLTTLRSCFSNIKKKFPVLPKSTEFTAYYGGQVKFSFTIKGKKQLYLASNEDLLRVDSEPKPQKIEKRNDYISKLEDLKKAASDYLKANKILKEHEDIDLESNQYIFKKFMKLIDNAADVQAIDDLESIVMKYKVFSDQIKFYREAIDDLTDDVLNTVLYDENIGRKVIQVDQTESLGGLVPCYYREYFTPNGKIEKKSTYQNHSKTTETHFNILTSKKDKTLEFYKGSSQISVESFFGVTGKPQKAVYYNENGSIDAKKYFTSLQDSSCYVDYFNNEGNMSYRETYTEQTNSTVFEMYDSDGNLFSIKQKYPNLSKDQYLDMLALKLDSPQKLELFFRLFMKYEIDSPDPDDPLKKGTKDSYGDYWQTIEETLDRVENDEMLGDCEDISFLAVEILLRQGKNAHVAFVPGTIERLGHAFAVWFEKQPDNTFIAYSMGTYGLDQSEPIRGVDLNAKDAVNALMVKYDEPNIGVDVPLNYRFSDHIGLLVMPEKSKQFKLKMPFNILFNRDLYNQIFEAKLQCEAKNYDASIAIYEAIINKNPKEPIFHELLSEGLKNKYIDADIKIFKKAFYSKINKYAVNSSFYHTRLGMLYQVNDKDKEAIEEFNHSIENGTKEVQTYEKLLLLLKTPEQRIDLLKKAINNGFHRVTFYEALSEESLKLGELVESKEIIKQALKNRPDRTYHFTALLAKINMEDNAPEAISILKELIVNQPEKNDAYYLLAGLYNKLGQNSNAISVYEQILASGNSINVDKVLFMAKYFTENSDLETGSNLYGSAIKVQDLSEEYSYAFKEYAKLLDDSGKTAEAQKVLMKGINKFPESAALKNFLDELSKKKNVN